MNNTLMCHRGGEKKLSDGLSGKQCLSCSRHTDLEDEDGYDDEEDHDEEDDGDGHPDYLASVELPGAGEVTDVEGEVCLHPPCAVLRYTFVPPTLTLWKSETFYVIICILGKYCSRSNLSANCLPFVCSLLPHLLTR